jgi:hypothetical protein
MKHYLGVTFTAVVGVGLYCAITTNPAGIAVAIAGFIILMVIACVI